MLLYSPISSLEKRSYQISIASVPSLYFLRRRKLSAFLSSMLIILSSAFLFLGKSVAQDAKFLGENGAWKAFSHKKGTVCFMVSEPKTQKGDFTKRGRPHVLITHHSKEKTFDTVSVVAGYAYKPKSEVIIQLGEKTFTFFTQDDTAWAADEKTDQAVVKAAIAGEHMRIKGISSRNKDIIDTYSLEGFSATHRLIDQACKNIKK